MSTHPPIAQTVVWRHPCDCKTASRPLAPGEEAEHRFDVDGQPFPWYIAEAGASFLKHGDLYLVRVQIYPLEVDGNRDPLDITISYWQPQPMIGDRPFPWAILDGSVSVEVAEGAFASLHLTFLANHVDADIEIPDLDMFTARTPHEAEVEAAERRKSLPPERAAVGAAIDHAAAIDYAKRESRRLATASRHGNQCAIPDCILDAGHPDHHESQHGASWRTYEPLGEVYSGPLDDTVEALRRLEEDGRA